MRRLMLTALLATLAAGGCGESVPKPRALTTEEKEKVKREDKAVEDEELGPQRSKSNKR